MNSLLTGKVCLGCASEQQQQQQQKNAINAWFSCVLLPWPLTLFLLPVAHYCFPFLGLPAAGRPTKVPAPGPCDVRAPAVRPVSAGNRCEKPLQRRRSDGVSGLPREAFRRELALGRYVPVLHLSTLSIRVFGNPVFIPKGCTDTGEPKVWDSFPTYV